MIEVIYNYHTKITKKDRQKLKWHKSFIIWFTGLSGAWKSTMAGAPIIKKLGFFI